MKGRVYDDLVLEMSPVDTVVTALDALQEGTVFTYSGAEISVREPVAFGHKVAVTTFDVGDDVVKYGEIIGRATDSIEPGEWVHTHNCESTRGRGDVAVEEGPV